MKKLTTSDIEFIAFRFARDFLKYNEPIPDFKTRFPNILESSLAVPFQEFGGRVIYKGLLEKASILFYLMIKNHPFQNGNKRIAMITLLVFLYQNNKWLKVSNQELYNFAVWVAQSPADLNDEVVLAIREFFKKHLIKIRLQK